MTPRHLSLPLTYIPKIEPVKRGDCAQTIRIVNYTKAHPEGNRKCVGDLVRFFTWSGRPYRSKRAWVMEGYKPTIEVIPVFIYQTGMKLFLKNMWVHCAWHQLNWLAALDCISPPTGEALRDVLTGKNGKIPEEGIEAQIIRWDYYTRGGGK